MRGVSRRILIGVSGGIAAYKIPALVRALRPGGVLLCETFTKGQEPERSPSNPEFLLEPGELPELVAPLEVVRQREGEYDGRCVAAVAARKPGRLPPRP